MSIKNETPPKILLAFDFGMKRIGVAIGQMVTQTARPLDTLPAKNGIPNWETLTKLINKWQPDALVVGIPLNMDGSPQKMSQHAHEFAEMLSVRFNIPIHKIDERLTTKAARENMFKQGG